jgi:hypothetical protein
VFVAKILVGAATTQTLNCQAAGRVGHDIKVVLVLFSQGDESQNGSDKFNLLTKWCGSGVAPVVKKPSSNKAQIKPNLGSNQCWISAQRHQQRVYKFGRALLFVAAFVFVFVY